MSLGLGDLARGLTRRSSGGRLVLVALAPFLIVLAALAGYNYLSYRQVTTQLVMERDLQLAYLSAARLEDELGKFADELLFLARTEQVVSAIPVRQRAALENASLRLSSFDAGVVLLDDFGKVRAAQPARPSDLGRDWSDRPYFRQLLGSTWVVYADSTSDGPGGTPAVVASVPIIGRDGEFRGALVGMFRLGQTRMSSFYASIVRLRIGQNGTTYVVNGSGTILYDSLIEQVGQPFAAVGLPGLRIGGQGSVVRTRDLAGRDVVAAQVPIPGTPWTLVTEEDWASLTGPSRGLLRTLFGALGLGTLVAASGVALLAKERGAAAIVHERSENEARVAQKIQRALLPDQVPVLPGWRVAVEFRQAEAGPIGFYDWLITPDGSLVLALGEVSTRAPESIAILATARTALRSATGNSACPGDALRHANKLLCPEMPPDTSSACLSAMVNPASGAVTIASAGYPSPRLWAADDLTEIQVNGAGLGVTLDEGYEESTVMLEPGQSLIFYSGNVLTAHDRHGDEFGPTRLHAVALQHGGGGRELGRAIIADLLEFAGTDAGLRGDTILLVVERLPLESLDEARRELA